MNSMKLIWTTFLLLFAGAVFAAVNLNTATPDELAALDGIGATKAEAIVKYRDKNGPFESVDGVTEVKGIGQATLDKNRSELTVKKSK